MTKKTQKQIDRDAQIYQISTMVAGDFKLQEVLDRLAEAAVRVTRTKACSIRLLDEAASSLTMRSTYGLSEEYRNKGVVSRGDPVIKAAFEGEAVILDDMRVDARVKYPEAAVKEGLISQLTVAMTIRNEPLGVLRLYSPKPKRFDADALSIARLVASQCAIAITNTRLYHQALEGAKMAEQMRLGGIIQRRMIPKQSPCVCGLDVAGVYKPCFQIGGDLYDFIQLDDHTICVSIADVIGKGIPAAIMMSMLRGTIRAYADGGYGRHTLEEIVGRLNKVAIRECRDGEFITLFMATIDVRAMTITYCNCGHEPAVLFRDGKVTELNKGGIVLGLMKNARYSIETVALKDDDRLLMYTDGLIDAMNFQGETWGRDRMLEVAARCMGCSAKQLIHSLLGYRRRFVGLARQIDDTSVVAIRIAPGTCPDDGKE